jgi:GNAT superfamily N-acetyltransferase
MLAAHPAPPARMPTIRDATEQDLAAILELIGADPISSTRPGHGVSVTPRVRAAFDAIAADPRQRLLVLDDDGVVIGSLQLSCLPGLARDGMWRAIVESLHVRADHRGCGHGESLLLHAEAMARGMGCGVMQLTTDKRRIDAHRFYLRLGYVASHEGMKKPL